MERKHTGRALLCAVLALVLLMLAGCSLFNTGNTTGVLPYEETFKELDTRYEAGSRPSKIEYETRIEIVIDESGETVTDEAGEPVTSVVTIEPETEPSTEQEVKPKPNYSPENLELLRLLYNQFTSSGNLLVAAWGTPNGALRQEKVTGPNGETISKFEEAIIALKDLGVNCLITSDEWRSDGALATTMSCAKNHSMSVWYNCSGQTAENAAEKLLSILTGTEANLLTGVLVGDRPMVEEQSNISRFCDELRTALGTSYRAQAKLTVNLRPYNTSFSATETAYAEYVKTFNAVQGVTATGVGIGMNYAVFNYSPYTYSDSDGLAGLIYSIDQVRRNSASMPLYPVISVGQTATSREPTIEELRAQINICLALGARGYILDNACGREGTSYDALIDKDGKTTSLYETAKAVYDELDGLREQYLLYTFSRMTLLNYEEANELLGGPHYTYTDSLVSGIMTEATEEQDRPVVIGNFCGGPSALDPSKRDSHAYYIVNPDTTRSITVTCTLDDKYLQIIWGSEGCEKADYANTFTIKLEPGEANFVIANRVS